MWLCDAWDVKPFDGDILEQPLGMLMIGAAIREYDRARAMYERDPEHTPAAMRDLVLLTAKASAEERQK